MGESGGGLGGERATGGMQRAGKDLLRTSPEQKAHRCQALDASALVMDYQGYLRCTWGARYTSIHA
jgi:hypothetical protein